MSAAGSNPAPSAAGPVGPVTATYRLARAHTVGVLGRLLAGCGVLVLAALLGAALVDDVPTWAAVVVVAVLVLALVPTAVAAVRVLRPPTLLRLHEQGYELHGVRGAGPTAARWDEVRTVRRERLRPGPCLVLALADRRRTVVPLRLVDGGAAAGDRLEADLSARLDRAHGQRRLG